MLIGIHDLNKYFGETPALLDVNLQVEAGDRIGIVGANGAGKTTLLRLLCGELEPDGGEIDLTRGARLGYLEQNGRLDPTRDVYGEMEEAFRPVLEALERMGRLEGEMARRPGDQELLEEHARCQAVVDAADGYHRDTQIRRVLSGMGFGEDTWHKKVSVLSGGEYTRLRLARLLVQSPEVLVLDEPTNHLDFATLEWLESFLAGYKGAVLAVSHDRYFLDKVCSRIWEVEENRVRAYRGSYSAYLPQREERRAAQEKQRRADLEKAKKLEDYVARNLVRASTTRMAQSRRRQLEKMEITQAPPPEAKGPAFRFEFDVAPYKEVLALKGLTVKIGERTLVQPLDLVLERGQRLVIAGPNGAGKSTLMQVLTGRRRPSAGYARLGGGVKPGFFEQQQARRAGTVESALWDQYPSFTQLEVRSHLARFGFKGEEVFKECAALSGGELARLRFAQLVLERPNLLFLDEPTNHLDIYTRDSLTQALEEYEGTLVLITHDRYLMERLACPILWLEGDGGWKIWPDFASLMAPRGATPAPAGEKKAPARPAWGKEERRRRAQLRGAVKAAEEAVDSLSEEIRGLEEKMNDPELLRDHLALEAACARLEEARREQDEKMEEWEELAGRLEELEGEE